MRIAPRISTRSVASRRRGKVAAFFRPILATALCLLLLAGCGGEPTAKQLELAVTGTGTVSTEFQRAFHETELDELVAGIPDVEAEVEAEA